MWNLFYYLFRISTQVLLSLTQHFSNYKCKALFSVHDLIFILVIIESIGRSPLLKLHFKSWVSLDWWKWTYHRTDRLFLHFSSRLSWRSGRNWKRWKRRKTLWVVVSYSVLIQITVNIFYIKYCLILLANS